MIPTIKDAYKNCMGIRIAGLACGFVTNCRRTSLAGWIRYSRNTK